MIKHYALLYISIFFKYLREALQQIEVFMGNDKHMKSGIERKKRTIERELKSSIFLHYASYN